MPRTVYTVGKHVLNRGPIETLREVKRRRAQGSMSHHMFPNGLVSGVDISAALEWYKGNSKKVHIVIPSYND